MSFYQSFTTLLVFFFLVCSDGGRVINVRAQQRSSQQQASVSCNAAYSAPCARTNSEYLSNYVSNELKEHHLSLQSTSDDFFRSVTEGSFNLDTGFYPFIFEADTSSCVAHGANPNLVGLRLSEILDFAGIRYANATALHQRFRQGGWVQYLWSDGGTTRSKLAYVVSGLELRGSTYYIGVGYENQPLPTDLPCSDKSDSWCSLTNVRSLVGRAQFLLHQAESTEQFEAALYEISFDPTFRVNEDFYLFLYNFNGLLLSHGVLRDSFGMGLSDIFRNKGIGSREEGQALHEKFVDAVTIEDTAWVRYEWRNSLDQATYTKIAFLVQVDFEGDRYYLGAGFEHAISSDSTDTQRIDSCSAEYNKPCSFQSSFALSSHTLAHTISSDDPVEERFSQISFNDGFHIGEFYSFVYDFNGTCVAHGLEERTGFVGMDLQEVFNSVGLSLAADVLHEKFRSAAEQGGGWVDYDWLVPGVANSDFKKIAYLFQINIDGRQYYAGVGFNNKRAPVLVNSDNGLKRNRDPVLCSSDFDLTCSEINTQAVLGAALADLTLATSTVSFIGTAVGLRHVLDSMTGGYGNSESYRVNDDFYVSVFSVDGIECGENSSDDAGCCIGHGGNPDLVGLTWNEILEVQEIASIRGPRLHNLFVQESASDAGGWMTYPWSKGSGVAQTKRAWVSRFRSKDKEYYVVSEYLLTPQPSTCDSCPNDMECATSEDQSFCELIPNPPFTQHPAFLSLIVLFLVGIPFVAVLFCRQKRRHRLKRRKLDEELAEMATKMEQQMQGMVEVEIDLPFATADEYQLKVGAGTGEAKDTVTGVWYWEEDESRLDSHKSSMVLHGTNFVGYSAEISDQIEHAHRLHMEGRGFKELRVDLTGKITSTADGRNLGSSQTRSHYEVDFETMQQRNSASNYQRDIRREEVGIVVDSQLAIDLPALPSDIIFKGENKEDLLPTFSGQVIQVSKVHQDREWLYGNVLYDPLLEMLDDAGQQQAQTTTSTDGVNAILSHALQDRPTSGWFPRSVTTPADVNVMQKLLNKLGGEGLDILTPPDTWDESRGDDRISVPKGSKEYDQIAHYFLAALYAQRDNVKVVKVERIQNLPLYQSYAVKLQTMKARYASTDNSAHRINNIDTNPNSIERRWLFHGTQPDVIPKIEKQGFNRSFAGKNAVAYGKGVYFARDASYSSHTTYSVPDHHGVQSMFLCRVAVGDWCKGRNEQLTPDPKPYNNLELFDSTVDNCSNPSIFVCYNDAQSYPEYLVSFKRK